MEQKLTHNVLFSAIDWWLWNTESLEGNFKRLPLSLLLLQQDNILCLNELRWCSGRSCIEAKSGSNVFKPLWLRSIDFWCLFVFFMTSAER